MSGATATELGKQSLGFREKLVAFASDAPNIMSMVHLRLGVRPV